MPVVLQAVLMLCGLGIQAAKGYHRFELGLYLEWLFGLQLVDYWLAVRARVHRACRWSTRSTSATSLMIVYFLAISFSDVLGFEHNLYKYGGERRLHVLGHERLRPLPRPRARLRRRTGRLRRCCSRSPATVLGAGHRRPIGVAACAWRGAASPCRSP